MVRAIWDGIYKELLSRIERGDYEYQGFLPSERVLVGEFGCSHNTLRKALAALASQGYVQPVHGKGVRVLYRRHERPRFVLGGIESFKETAERNHLDATTRVASFGHVTCDEELSRQTGFAVGEGLIAISRLRLLDGAAVILDKCLFLASAVGNLTPEIAERSIYEYFEGELGLHIALSNRVITVERATPEDEALLDLGGFDALAVVTGQSFSREGVLVERTQSRHRADCFAFFDTATRGVEG